MSKQIGANEMRRLAALLEKELKGLGFALFVFKFKEPGMSNYISNAVREDMMIALEEKLRIFKNQQDFKTPEEN